MPGPARGGRDAPDQAEIEVGFVEQAVEQLLRVRLEVGEDRRRNTAGRPAVAAPSDQDIFSVG
jgi:hypothetical protein